MDVYTYVGSVRGFLLINLPVSWQGTGSAVRCHTKHCSYHVATEDS